MKQAQLEEFGPDPGVATFPSKFFRSDVYVYQGPLPCPPKVMGYGGLIAERTYRHQCAR